MKKLKKNCMVVEEELIYNEGKRTRKGEEVTVMLGPWLGHAHACHATSKF